MDPRNGPRGRRRGARRQPAAPHLGRSGPEPNPDHRRHRRRDRRPTDRQHRPRLGHPAAGRDTQSGRGITAGQRHHARRSAREPLGSRLDRPTAAGTAAARRPHLRRRVRLGRRAEPVVDRAAHDGQPAALARDLGTEPRQLTARGSGLQQPRRHPERLAAAAASRRDRPQDRPRERQRRHRAIGRHPHRDRRPQPRLRARPVPGEQGADRTRRPPSERPRPDPAGLDADSPRHLDAGAQHTGAHDPVDASHNPLEPHAHEPGPDPPDHTRKRPDNRADDPPVPTADSAAHAGAKSATKSGAEHSGYTDHSVGADHRATHCSGRVDAGEQPARCSEQLGPADGGVRRGRGAAGRYLTHRLDRVPTSPVPAAPPRSRDHLMLAGAAAGGADAAVCGRTGDGRRDVAGSDAARPGPRRRLGRGEPPARRGGGADGPRPARTDPGLGSAERAGAVGGRRDRHPLVHRSRRGVRLRPGPAGLPLRAVPDLDQRRLRRGRVTMAAGPGAGRVDVAGRRPGALPELGPVPGLRAGAQHLVRDAAGDAGRIRSRTGRSQPGPVDLHRGLRRRDRRAVRAGAHRGAVAA